MQALPESPAAEPLAVVGAWPSGQVLLLVLAAGCLAAIVIQTLVARKRRQAMQMAEAERAAGRSRLRELQAQLARRKQENQCLQQALARRSLEVELLTARMAEAASRDREELVRLQEELESDHRIGLEKARLLRSLEASLQHVQRQVHHGSADRERQRVGLSALQAALSHAKRAQASTEGRLAQLREQLRAQAVAGAPRIAPDERVVERIVEVAVETIVYREVPVEVPIEVPVGFSTFAAPPSASGLRPRYSENRPSST
jgi:hypothetical protein